MHPTRRTHYLQVTAALIPAQGQLFIAQRPPHKKHGHLWEFPGGKAEDGETLEEALIREIREELSWNIDVGRLFQKIRYSQGEFRIELHAFWCCIRGGSLDLREHVDYRWVSVQELKHYDLTGADALLIYPLEALPNLPSPPWPP